MEFKDAASIFDLDVSEFWIVKEDVWEPTQERVCETRFTLGNGHLCSRGAMEELIPGATPGTYIAGVYDRTGAQITELVNLPNPFYFRIDVEGEKLDLVAMDNVHHSRALDLRHGILHRHTVYRTAHRNRIDYRSRRLVSLANKQLMLLEIAVVPLDADMTISVQTRIDTGVYNQGALSEGQKRHFHPVEFMNKDGLSYLAVETFDNRVLVAYGSALEVQRKNRRTLVADRAVNLRVRRDEKVTFRKYVVVGSSRNSRRSELKRTVIRHLKKVYRNGFAALVNDHRRAWDDRWSVMDVEIEGDPEAARALRFNMYHLCIAGSEEDDASIGARTLSGEGYRGHVFWDTEIFVLPFFIYTAPAIAANLLLYRYRRLAAARNIAEASGYRGTLFPWESADSGEECTPSWAKNFDGSIVKIVTMEQEQHVVADIAFGFAQYCQATGSGGFFGEYALEVMIECARFWVSRVTYNEDRGQYEILKVMGPDEFHEGVDNNAYTNMMAQWNLRTAIKWCGRARREQPRKMARLARRLGLTAKEIRQWRTIAAEIVVPWSDQRKLLEPFEGYFGLRDSRIKSFDEHKMPVLPASVDWEGVGKTKLIKQADVVMLLYLLGDRFTLDEKKRNYYYYERRTLHKSSLSPAIHSIVGLEVGDESKARHHYSRAVSTDLDNIYGNTAEGFHAAAGGGSWQAAIMGFAGMRPGVSALSFCPHLPGHWQGMRFSVFWRGALLRVHITHKSTEVRCETRSPRGPVQVEVYGKVHEFQPHTAAVFSPPGRRKGRSRIAESKGKSKAKARRS